MPKPSAFSCSSAHRLRRAQLTFLAGAAALLLAVAACNQDNVTPGSNLAALPLTVSTMSDNPGSQAKAELGRALFWDPVLSGGRDVSCATGYAGGLDLAVGVNGTGLGRARHFRSPVSRSDS